MRRSPRTMYRSRSFSLASTQRTPNMLFSVSSTVIGYDFCGRVLSVPSGSKFSKGDIVAGYTPSGIGRSSRYGTHQAHCYCPEDIIFKVPSHLPESHAAALTVVAMTAADTVYNIFKLPLPASPAVHSRSIIIWGASSSVGICTLQFLMASGCQNILVAASPSRHELLRSLSATHTFDYNSLTVEADVVAAVQALGEGSVSHALDAAGTFTQPSSADMLARAVDSPELYWQVPPNLMAHFKCPWPRLRTSGASSHPARRNPLVYLVTQNGTGMLGRLWNGLPSTTILKFCCHQWKLWKSLPRKLCTKSSRSGNQGEDLAIGLSASP